MAELALGIDLGTSNSVVAVAHGAHPVVLADERGARLQPSVVSWPTSGGILVGHAARERLAVDPTRTIRSSKRLMGRPIYTPEAARVSERAPWPIEEGPNRSCQFVIGTRRFAPEDVAAEILKHLTRLAERDLGRPCRRAVISVPATFREAQRTATLRAGELAGLEVLRLVNEPTAAALAYGFGRDQGDQLIAIYDLGGGTFDITILRQRGHVFEVKATAGDIFLGGDDVDDAIARKIADSFVARGGADAGGDPRLWQRLRLSAEALKCQLSDARVARASLAEVLPGDALPTTMDFELTRDDLDAIVQPLVQRTLVTCDEAMRLARVSSSDIDHLVLVGGSTRLTALREMVSGYFFRDPRSDIDPDEVVAVGAAIYAQALVAPSWGDAPEEIVPERPTSARVRAARAAAEATVGSLDLSGPDLDEDMLVEHTSVGIPTLRGDDFEAGDTAVGRPSGDEDAIAPVSDAPSGLRVGATPAARQSSPPPRPPAPLLVDVTSHAIGVATLGGVFDAILERNAKVPARRTREFTTTRNGQTSVRLRVYEGSARRIEDNDQLGELLLNGLRPAPRGQVRVAVTLSLDTNATLEVEARDVDTGKLAQTRLKIAGLADR